MKGILKLVPASLISLAIMFPLTTFADDTPKIDCKITNQDSDFEKAVQVDKLPKDVAKVYMLCSVDDITQTHKAKAVWIADDTNGVAPANYKIDETSIDVVPPKESDQVWVGHFDLTKPTKGWPVGKYHVELYVDGTLMKSLKFTIS